MKHVNALLILILVCTCSQTVSAQAEDSWVSVKLAGERFTVLMPKTHVVKPEKVSFEKFKTEGRVYTAARDGVDFAVWSLVDGDYERHDPAGIDAYLDACADLVWEALLKPLRDELPKKPQVVSYMAYQRELASDERPPGREYTIMLGNRLGVTRFYVDEARIYVLTALRAKADLAATQRFINSFGIKGQALPVAATIQVDPLLIPPYAGIGTGSGVGPGSGIGPGTGIGPGRGGNIGGGDRRIVGEPAGETDYNQIFSGRDVTQKVRVLSKPEPSYTETARKYAVQGTVIMRAVFARSGEVENIKILRGLPHGLTEKALAAARRIKFSPALKDGHEVSMYIQLEYNFNLY